MHYTQHPDYPKYKDIIEAIFKEGFEPTNKDPENIIREKPQLLAPEFYKITHQQDAHYIGKKFQKLTVIGFLKPENLSSSEVNFVCQCDCGMYALPTKKLIKRGTERSYITCQSCKELIDGFDLEFMRRVGQGLTSEALHSIFDLNDPQEFEKFVNDPPSKEPRQFSPLRFLTKEQYKALLDGDRELERQYLRLNEKGCLVCTTTGRGQTRAIAKPKEMVDLKLLTDVPYHVYSAPSKRYFRLTIIGIYQNFKPLTTEHLNYVAQCDCGYYASFNHQSLNHAQTACCNRCSRIIDYYISNQKDQGRIITNDQAWEELGFDTSRYQAEADDIRKIRTNAYSFEKKIYDHASNEYQQYVGQKFGLVEIKGKSRKFREGKERTPFIGKCECGAECFVPFKYYQPDTFIACSACLSLITSLFGVNPINKPMQFVNGLWKQYLKYIEMQTSLNFIQAFKLYLYVQDIEGIGVGMKKIVRSHPKDSKVAIPAVYKSAADTNKFKVKAEAKEKPKMTVVRKNMMKRLMAYKNESKATS